MLPFALCVPTVRVSLLFGLPFNSELLVHGPPLYSLDNSTVDVPTVSTVKVSLLFSCCPWISCCLSCCLSVLPNTHMCLAKRTQLLHDKCSSCCVIPDDADLLRPATTCLYCCTCVFNAQNTVAVWLRPSNHVLCIQHTSLCMHNR